MTEEKCCEYSTEELYSCTKYEGEKCVYGGTHCRACGATYTLDLETMKWVRTK